MQELWKKFRVVFRHRFYVFIAVALIAILAISLYDQLTNTVKYKYNIVVLNAQFAAVSDTYEIPEGYSLDTQQQWREYIEQYCDETIPCNVTCLRVITSRGFDPNINYYDNPQDLSLNRTILNSKLYSKEINLLIMPVSLVDEFADLGIIRPLTSEEQAALGDGERLITSERNQVEDIYAMTISRIKSIPRTYTVFVEEPGQPEDIFCIAACSYVYDTQANIQVMDLLYSHQDCELYD